MSEFFTNYPTINYNIDKNRPVNTVRAVNLMNRIKFQSKILNNVMAYYPYKIKENERPDVIAYNYYGSVSYTWLIFLANNIIDPQFDWPLWGSDFRNYIKNKYGSIADAQANIHHYEQILRNDIPASPDYARILEKTAIVDETTYNSLNSSEKRTVTQYDYEIIEREKKRNIILIEDIYAKSIQDDFRNFYG